MNKLLLLLIVMIGLIVSLAYKPYVLKMNIKEYDVDMVLINNFKKEWDSERRVTEGTPRFLLARQIETLRKIKDKFYTIETKNECVNNLKIHYQQYMTFYINALDSFSNPNTDISSDLIPMASEELTKYNDGIDTCHPKKSK